MAIRLTLAALGLFESGVARAADFRLTPAVAVSGEYNDNIDEVAQNRRRAFITRVQPGAALHYLGNRASAEAAYGLEYRHYALTDKDDSLDHNLALKGSVALVENFLFLEASDSFSRVSLDLARDTRAESVFVNQTDQNVATVSPYLIWRLKEKGALRTGYRYIDTRYWSPTAVDKKEHVGFAELGYEFMPRLNFTASYLFSDVISEPRGYRKSDLLGGLRYEYADGCFLYGTVGNSWQQFDLGPSVSDPIWSVGLSHDFGPLVAALETRVQYAEDPLTLSTRQTSYSATLTRTRPEGTFGVAAAYTEFVLTETGALDRRQLLLSATLKRELTSRLTLDLGVSGDRSSPRTDADYPYHLIASAGVGYGFNYDTRLALNYSFVTYRRAYYSGFEAKNTNRIVAELRKSF